MQDMNSNILKLKPEEGSLKLKHDNRNYSYSFKGTTLSCVKLLFKLDFLKKGSFVYRCADRKKCPNVVIHVDVEANFNMSKIEDNTKFFTLKDPTSISWILVGTHECEEEAKENLYQVVSSDVLTLKRDKATLVAYVNDHATSTSSQVRSGLLNQGYKFPLKEIQNEKYSKDTFLSFSPEFCKSIDYDTSKQNISKAYMKLPSAVESKPYSEIVVLCSDFQLLRLAQSEDWYTAVYKY